MPFFDYNTGIPDGPNNPSDDQPLMKINTNSINSILVVDHYGFNDNNGGLHKQTTFVNETAPATAVGQLSLYSKGALGGPSQLFMIRDNNAGTEVALTPTPTLIGNASRTTRGYSWLPGNILIQWGTDSIPNGTSVVNYIVNFAVVGGFTPAVIATGEITGAANEAVSVLVAGVSSFSVRNQSGAVRNLFWTAIGPI